MIYVAFTLTLQSKEMTNASGLQGVNVSRFAHFDYLKKKGFRQHLFFFFNSTIMASAISFKQSQYIYP